MDISLFDFSLPKESIAQGPASPRDSARLLVINKNMNTRVDSKISQLPDILQRGDVLVFNNSKVIPARLIGKKISGGKVEVFLLHKESSNTWTALVGSKGKKENLEVVFTKDVSACVVDREDKVFTIRFSISGDTLDTFIERHGNTPTPPYIKKKSRASQYQTVFADTNKKGSVAAPTAGLHFTKRLLARLKKRGVQIEFVTLHVGLGTFAPVTTQNIKDHPMHPEFVEISRGTIKKVLDAKKQGRRIIAVGTTSVRTLEGALVGIKKPRDIHKWINPYYYPGYRFQIIDGMVTNFHLPKSTLFMLISAFSGRERMLAAYKHAIDQKYRFYSFGDAMLLL